MTAQPTDTSPPDDSEPADASDSAAAEAAPESDETDAAAESLEASAAPADAAKIDFERAEFEEPKRDEIECSACHRTIRTEYWQIGGNKILCEPCRKIVEQTAVTANGGAAFGKAFLYGSGAALLCGTGYAIFVALSDRQFALVTIGIGWAVGTAVQKVTRGFGGRKYQILAVALTYFATTMSYAPAIFNDFRNLANEPTPSGSSAPAATDAPALAPANAPAPAAPENAPAVPAAADTPAPASGMNPGVALLILVAAIVAFMLAAPVLSLGGSSGIGGLLGLLIIFFGLRMAWRTSKGITPTITGPHQVDASEAA